MSARMGRDQRSFRASGELSDGEAHDNACRFQLWRSRLAPSFSKLCARASLAAAIVSRSTPSAAEPPLPTPLTLSAVTEIARTRRAEITAAKEEVRAGWAKAGAVGKPPDPMLMLNLAHLPLPVVMGADVSAMWQQAVPLSGELAARIRSAEWKARSLDAAARTKTLDVELEASRAFLMLAETQAMRALIDKQVALAAAVEKVVLARLAGGAGVPTDAVRVGLERSRLEIDQEALTGRAKQADAMLDAALGRRPDSAVPTCALPDPPHEASSSAQLARAALRARPEIAAMHSRIRAAEEEVEVMRNMRAPMGLFGLGAAYTMSDGFGLMTTVGMSFPIWESNYDKSIAEAKAMASMQRAELDAMATMIDGSVVAAHQGEETARLRERAIRTRLLPQAQQVFDMLLASYAGGETSIVSVLEGLSTLQAIEMESIIAKVELATARATLARSVGDVGLKLQSK